MRTHWVLLLVCGSIVLGAGPRLAQVQPFEMERALVERFGFSAAEIGQLRGSQVVVKTLPGAWARYRSERPTSMRAAPCMGAPEV
jgi:hypothetical protein